MGQVSLELCSGSHQADIKVLARAANSPEAWGPLPNSLAGGQIQSLALQD